MSDQSAGGKKFLLGAVVGGTLGAVAGLLFAPKPGRELRNDIAAQVHTVSKKTQSIAGNVKQQGKVFVDAVKNLNQTKKQDPTESVAEQMTEATNQTNVS